MDIIYNLHHHSILVAVVVNVVKTKHEGAISHLQFSGEEDCDYVYIFIYKKQSKVQHTSIENHVCSAAL